MISKQSTKVYFKQARYAFKRSIQRTVKRLN